ncbi:DNA mismatch repair protein MutS, core [Kalmanozyma brasiliensis GHG001]|uniref:DNA mismatch repair protein MSH2 n=2 Tax=Kalmanozyma brasiliensis TaxID=1392244 RepID=V5GH19_KALBG|nr:DNA mismatch repair protein MutS, core [Kalmanozyma brasiliensis GHG001]EST05312.1 DNA mismatch repair protein MutS, core [Kalmanozyma brasiliensis GHG001]DBA11314.1 TPA_inf: MSH2 [Kalmanozyma brasiliensis]
MSGLMYDGPSTSEKPDLGLDNAAESSFCQTFRAMPKPSPGTLRLFDRSDFYSAHGDDAILIANQVFKTHSALKYLGSGGKDKGGLPSITLSVAAAKNFLREALTSRQMRVEIYGNAGGKRNNQWTIIKQASPGNLQQMEDMIFVNADIVSSPIVMALKMTTRDGVKTVGAAFADATNRELCVSEYAENDLYSNTESLIIQLGVKECILPKDDKSADVDLKKLKEVIDRCGVVMFDNKRADFGGKNIDQDLRRLLKEESSGITIPELDLKVAMGAASALITYLGLLTDESNFGQYTIRTHDLSQYLRLDNSALRALNLFPEPGQTGSSKNTSVYGLLNRCRTGQGQRLLGQWLKQPLVNVHAIEERQNLVELFINDNSARQLIQTDYLKLMPDMHRISKRFQKGIATLEDVVRVYQAVLRLPGLIQTLSDMDTPSETHAALLETTYIAPFSSHAEALTKYNELVEATLDLNELTHHNFVIKPDFDDNLRQIKEALDDTRDKLDEQHRLAGKELRMDTEKKLHLENHHVYGYCLRVTRTDAGLVRNKKGYSDIATVKGGLYFTNEALRDLANDFKDLSERYSRSQSGLVKEVIQIASSYCPPLEKLNVVLAHLDVVVSFAHVSDSAPIPYVKPKVRAKGTSADVDLREARHPCLEVMDDVTFIPNDTEMVRGASEFLVITGPNMGGKSTYIRQVGIIALLAQVGCFVPAAPGASLPVFDCILARVGAGDSQLKGVSTFMAEMLETATILKTATSDSLLIIDELGRGTSTYDGFGLAWAISEYIATHVRCKCLFATHFHELTNLASQQAHVRNLHVVAHVQPKENAASRHDRDITLLYKVVAGISDQSLGINVAELANFPPSVIRLAKRKAEELEDYEEDEAKGVLDSVDDEATREGAQLIDEFLKTWAERSGENKSGRRDAETELQDLRKVVDEFRPRIEANPWAAKVLESF